MYLTDKLATQIIDSLMYLVDYNIFITDKNGLVLASKDNNEIGTFNLPALQAVQMVSTQLVFPDQEESFQVSTPGVVMPLRSDGCGIGALGIKGHPEVIKEAAAMAIKITELLIEREIMQQEVRSRYQLRDQFIGLIIAGSTNQQDIIHLSDILRFNLNLSRMVVIVNIIPKQSTLFQEMEAQGYNTKAAESARYLVQSSTFVTSSDLIGLWDQRLLILKHIPGTTKKFDQWCTDLISLLTGNIRDVSVQLGIGSFVDVYSLLPASYQQARFCLNKCPPNGFASIYDYAMLSEYLFENSDELKELHPVKALVDKIRSARLIEKYDIANTILSLLTNNLSLIPTAKALFIHRNTLTLRLDKLKESTGLDPFHCFDHAIICKFLFATSRFMT